MSQPSQEIPGVLEGDSLPSSCHRLPWRLSTSGRFPCSLPPTQGDSKEGPGKNLTDGSTASRSHTGCPAHPRRPAGPVPATHLLRGPAALPYSCHVSTENRTSGQLVLRAAPFVFALSFASPDPAPGTPGPAPPGGTLAPSVPHGSAPPGGTPTSVCTPQVCTSWGAPAPIAP